MNKILINILAFAAGAGAGFLITKKILEERYETRAQEEYDAMKEFFEVKMESLKPIKAEELGDIVNQSLGIEPEKTEEPKKTEKPPRKAYHLIGAGKADAVPLDELVEDPEDEEEDDGELRDAAGKTEGEMDLTKVDRLKPYIINDHEFTEEFDHHDKVSLYFYRADGVLAEENEEMIDDPDATIGREAMDQLDEGCDTLWVRNEPIAIDYEIVAVNKSYAEMVYGAEMTPNMSPRERYNHKHKQRREEDE